MDCSIQLSGSGANDDEVVGFHDLRATGITWMAVRGDEHLRIKQRAGHRGFSTTEMYIREAENLRDGFGTPFPPLPDDLTGSGERSKLRSNHPGSDQETRAVERASLRGATGDRTPDLRIANAALSQLSYCPG